MEICYNIKHSVVRQENLDVSSVASMLCGWKCMLYILTHTYLYAVKYIFSMFQFTLQYSTNS